MSVEMSDKDSKCINNYYMIISNIERIGDHAMNIAEYLKSLKKWSVRVSDNANSEIRKMKQVSLKILECLERADEENSQFLLEQAAKYENLIDDMQKKYLKRQIKRIRKGNCKAEAGILFSELLTDFERIGDYALNLAELYADM